jgi:hypothetical protein
MGEQGETVRFGLRLPKPLYERLATAARKNNRSINSEIVSRLNPKVSTLVNVHTQEALRLVIEGMIRLMSESKSRSDYREMLDKLHQYMAEAPPELSAERVSRALSMNWGVDALE